MGTITITDEKKLGTLLYKEGDVVISGDCKYTLDTNELISISGTITKENKYIGTCNIYNSKDNGEKVTISNVNTSLLFEITEIVNNCINSTNNYYSK